VSAPAPTRKSRGFTLVEVLVALVVMAVGLLGIAALYVEGLRAGRTASYRAAAVTLAGDMADRIRANRDGAYAGTGPGADNGCVNGGGDCSANELAADDWLRWRGDLAARLPQGATGEITRNVVGGAVEFEITLSWPEAGQEAPSSYTLAVRP
jgi:type IV pilus assembly protein PilV